MMAMPNDVTKVREINIELVRSTLKKLGETTKARLADETGMSVATCGKILNDLVKAGEVFEIPDAQAQAGCGRPAKTFRYNADYALAACVYLATDNRKMTLSTVVANMIGGTVEETVEEIDKVDYATIRDAVARLLQKRDGVRVVSVGIPGHITDGTVRLCNFVELNGLPLADRLAEEFPGVAVIVENDMNAAAYGLYREICRDRESTIGLIFSPDGVCTGSGPDAIWKSDSGATISNTELGGGFVSEGRILRGFSGFAGEVWSLPVCRRGAKREIPLTVAVMADIIASIVPILNPEMIALTGGFANAELVEQVKAACLEFIEPQHMPRLIFRDNIHKDYISGLIFIALEQLSCDILLVKKRI